MGFVITSAYITPRSCENYMNESCDNVKYTKKDACMGWNTCLLIFGITNIPITNGGRLTGFCYSESLLYSHNHCRGAEHISFLIWLLYFISEIN